MIRYGAPESRQEENARTAVVLLMLLDAHRVAQATGSWLGNGKLIFPRYFTEFKLQH